MGKSRRRDFDAWEEEEHIQHAREIRKNRKRKSDRFDEAFHTEEEAFRNGITVRKRRNAYEDT